MSERCEWVYTGPMRESVRVGPHAQGVSITVLGVSVLGVSGQGHATLPPVTIRALAARMLLLADEVEKSQVTL